MTERYRLPFDILDPMILPTSAPASRVVVTSPFRLVLVSLLLSSLLLMLGIACATYTAVPVSAASSAVDGPPPLDGRDSADEPSVVSASESVLSSIGAVAALCALGVFCGVLLLLLGARRLRRPPTGTGVLSLHLVIRFLPRVAVRPVALTLTQLRVSRT